MPSEVWTPENGDNGGPLQVVIPGATVAHRCMCGAEFFDTGDSHADEERFLRHFERCWRKFGEDKIGEEIEMRRNDPIASHDEEHLKYLRRQAKERGE